MLLRMLSANALLMAWTMDYFDLRVGMTRLAWMQSARRSRAAAADSARARAGTAAELHGAEEAAAQEACPTHFPTTAARAGTLGVAVVARGATAGAAAASAEATAAATAAVTMDRNSRSIVEV